MYNKNRFNENFSNDLIRLVWQKATIVAGHNPSMVRKDYCGAWIEFDKYGITSSEFGWEIDHKYPKALGGGDQISNLQPLQWQNNRNKGDNYPYWNCLISAK